MESVQRRLQRKYKGVDVRWDVIERDYVLSWLLAGIAQDQFLSNSLTFKGGTALKKCYFANYRFSEDLDFSYVGPEESRAQLADHVRKVVEWASSNMNKYGLVLLQAEPLRSREPHPNGQQAYTIRAQLPWHRQLMTTVKVEITVDEPLLWAPQSRALLVDYEPECTGAISTYALEEIMAEKLRGILQYASRLKEHGWSRSRARDFYDLWRILGAYSDQVDRSDFHPRILEKMQLRNVDFSGTDDFFQSSMVAEVKRAWNPWLAPLVPELPSWERVQTDLRPWISELLETVAPI